MLDLIIVASLYPNGREISLKIVFFGPPRAGKGSALSYLHRALRPETRGQVISVTTGSDRTLFFDFFPQPTPRLRTSGLRMQLYTATGEVHSDSTRRALLEDVRGVIFLADSQREREADNALALEQLREGLGAHGLRLEQLPHVFAWNKRDLGPLLTPAELSARLNRDRMPAFETVATTGRGIFDALKAVTSQVLGELPQRRPGSNTPGGLGLDGEPVRSSSGERGTPRPRGGARDEAPPTRTRSGEVAAALTAQPTAILPGREERSSRHPERAERAGQAGPATPAALAALQQEATAVRTPVPTVVELRAELPPSVETAPRRPTFLQPLAPERTEATIPGLRELRLSVLTPPGPLRDQVSEIEQDLSTGQSAQAVRRARAAFQALTAADVTREPDEGQAFRALALGLPVDRYLRFREAARNADAGTASPEDGAFALFFLVDAILRS